MLVIALAAIFAACERPDASDVTSPSGRSLLGSTDGAAAYEADVPPPEPMTDSDGWEFTLGNARFSKLENGQASIQVVTRLISQPGATMEFWLWREGHVPLHWTAEGTTTPYNGVFCYQVRLEDGDESLRLDREQYYFTVGFRDEESGEWVSVREIRVAGNVPQLNGNQPGSESRVGTELLGCPRSVI